MAEAATESPTTAIPSERFAPAPAPTLDLSTLTGVSGGFALIAIAVAIGGSIDRFLDLPALLIVVGGTTFVTAISYGLSDFLKVPGVFLQTMVYNVDKPQAAAQRILMLALEARQNGPLGLDRHIRRLRHSPFLRLALGLVVDGHPDKHIQTILNNEAEAGAEREYRSTAIFRRAGEIAPAMGLIGTLIGLVQMLGRLDDPSAIGPAMAVALLTTFYGAVLAHMVFLPLAHKLERTAQQEQMVKRIYTAGILSISRQENPRHLETTLNAMLAPGDRLRIYG